MRGYSEREVFSEDVVAIWKLAVRDVERVESHHARCHELARAVQCRLQAIGNAVELVDGKMFVVEHSWLELMCRHGAGMQRYILDVYCPGRLPQVQLIDSHMVIGRDYVHGPRRTDINTTMVDQLVKEMTR